MSEPKDEELYAASKREVDKSYDKPSAYRSMAYSKTYMKKYREKYGDGDAYKGKNPGSLSRWRRERWIDVKSFLKDPKNPVACGSVERKRYYPLCMPIAKARSYSKSELGQLVQRKNQIGKRRLIQEDFLKEEKDD